MKIYQLVIDNIFIITYSNIYSYVLININYMKPVKVFWHLEVSHGYQVLDKELVEVMVMPAVLLMLEWDLHQEVDSANLF